MVLNGFALKDLVNLEGWQKAQDSFSEVLGITLRTLNAKGMVLTRTSGPKLLCAQIFPRISKTSKYHRNCVLHSIPNTRTEIREPLNLKCPFGLDLYAIPIKAFRKDTIAYLIVGPVILNKRKSMAQYANYAKRAHVELIDLMDALIEISVFSHSRIHSIIKLLSHIFTDIAQAEYHKKRLGEIAPEVTKLDPLFSGYYEDKVLSTLLNTCTTALDADSGSVMTVDKKTNHLHIKAASSLTKKIMQDTNQKVGKGIAGLAAATAEPIILPRDRSRNGLSKKMKRAYIKSSMIVPFSKANQDDVYGVINLNVARKQRDFSEKDVAFVKELTNLASIALIPVLR